MITKEHDTDSSTKRRIIVIGAGISGLAAAYKLVCNKIDLEVILLEANAKAGGVIGTLNQTEAIIECGPEAFTTAKPAIVDLAESLGISDRIIGTSDQHRTTFVAFDKKLHPLPDGFVLLAPTKFFPFIMSRLFSLCGKLRMALDLVIPRRIPTEEEDETLAGFVNRRLGREALERVAQPMVAGIQTAHPENLSVKSAMPQLLEFEKKHGSIILGLLSERFKLNKTNGTVEGNSRGARYGTFATFDKGMSVLVSELVKALPAGCLKTNHQVTFLVPGTERRFDVHLKDGTKLPADGVILALPAPQAARIVFDAYTQLASLLNKIPFASSVVVSRLYQRSAIPHPLRGFGFVVPRSEERTILACTFSSVKFVNRAPQDKVLLRIFAGGALQPGIYALADQKLEELITRDLSLYLGITSKPLRSIISRHLNRTPQYHVGHTKIIKEIQTVLAGFPGLALAGNAYAGAGLADCVASGNKAAESVLLSLANSLTIRNPVIHK